jgi:hypothetical protein
MSNNNFDSNSFIMKVEEVDVPYSIEKIQETQETQETINIRDKKYVSLIDLDYKELEAYLNKICDLQTYIDESTKKDKIKINQEIMKKELEEQQRTDIETDKKIKFIKNSIDEISKGFDRLETTLKKFKPYN